MPDDSGKLARRKMKYDALEKTFNDLRDEKAKVLGEKSELLKEPTELAKRSDEYLKNHVSLLPQKNSDDLIRKNQNSFDYTILGHESNVNEFGVFFFSSRRRHTRLQGDSSSDVCSSD